MTYRFRLQHDVEFYDATKLSLAKLVDDRNELVHHMLPLLDTTSVASCEELGRKLDAQAEKTRHAVRHMQTIAQAMQQARKDLAAKLARELS